MNRSNTNKDFPIQISLFIISLLFRYVKLFFDPLLMRDATYYLVLSEHWFFENDWTSIPYNDNYTEPPLMFWAIKVAMRSGFSSEICGRALNIFLSSFFPVIVYSIAQNILKRKQISLISAIIVLVHPNIASYSVQPIRENMYLIISGILILCQIKALIQRSSLLFFISGILLSIDLFCRLESIEFIPLIILSSVIYFQRNKYNFNFVARKISIFLLGLFFSTYFLYLIIQCDMSFLYKAFFYAKTFQE